MVLHGSIGNYMTVARRKGESWFVGTIVNDGIELDIPMDFLGDGTYTAKVYKEDPNRNRDVIIQSHTRTSGCTLTATMSSGSGHAIWIYPNVEN
mgnify:CR=1 FL=1